MDRLHRDREGTLHGRNPAGRECAPEAQPSLLQGSGGVDSRGILVTGPTVIGGADRRTLRGRPHRHEWLDLEGRHDERPLSGIPALDQETIAHRTSIEPRLGVGYLDRFLWRRARDSEGLDAGSSRGIHRRPHACPPSACSEF